MKKKVNPLSIIIMLILTLILFTFMFNNCRNANVYEIFSSGVNPNANTDDLIALGQSYFDTGDYSNSIISFNYALSNTNLTADQIYDARMGRATSIIRYVMGPELIISTILSVMDSTNQSGTNSLNFLEVLLDKSTNQQNIEKIYNVFRRKFYQKEGESDPKEWIENYNSFGDLQPFFENYSLVDELHELRLALPADSRNRANANINLIVASVFSAALEVFDTSRNGVFFDTNDFIELAPDFSTIQIKTNSMIFQILSNGNEITRFVEAAPSNLSEATNLLNTVILAIDTALEAEKLIQDENYLLTNAVQAFGEVIDYFTNYEGLSNVQSQLAELYDTSLSSTNTNSYVYQFESLVAQIPAMKLNLLLMKGVLNTYSNLFQLGSNIAEIVSNVPASPEDFLTLLDTEELSNVSAIITEILTNPELNGAFPTNILGIEPEANEFLETETLSNINNYITNSLLTN